MNIAYLLVSLGLGIFAVAMWAMFWAIDSGQYDDVEAHGRSILEDDVEVISSPKPSAEEFIERP